MNEFEWRRQLRDLRQPQAPQRDLWPSINTALDNAGAFCRAADPAQPCCPPIRPRQRLRWLFAASFVAAALLAGAIGWRQLQAPAAMPFASMASTAWQPADPRLAGATIELDSARMELQQAIEQAPDSAALQRLLARTKQQQSQLHQLSHQAG